MASWQEQLELGAREALGRPLSELEGEKFSKYMHLLLRWQRVHRLTASADPDRLATELLVDSLLFLRVVPPTARRILDFGSGAGFPGVPIAIVRPDTVLTLLESRQRRASFLAAVVRELPLPNTSVRSERAESALDDLAGAFDAVVMRCAGAAADIAHLAVQFTPVGGVVIVSGPPREEPVPRGRWVETPGVGRRGPRRFLVISRPDDQDP